MIAPSISSGRIETVATEVWSAAFAFGGAIGGALIALVSAKSLRREDIVSANLKTQLDGWKSLAIEYQSQVAYRDRQIKQYIVIIEVLREERSQDRLKIDECERSRIALYHEINELRKILNLSEIHVPQVEPPPNPFVDFNDDSNKPTC